MVEKIIVKNLNVFYGKELVLKSINFSVHQNEILGIIGPANSGKTSFLRTLNRLNDLIQNFRIEGTIYLDNKNIYKEINVELLRKNLGMLFALPLPLPMSIFDNIAYGPRMSGIKNKGELNKIIENSLKSAFRT